MDCALYLILKVLSQNLTTLTALCECTPSSNPMSGTAYLNLYNPIQHFEIDSTSAWHMNSDMTNLS